MPRVHDSALDRRLGLELRRVRLARNQALTEVAAAIGCSYQQLQKYERGQNAVPIAALVALGRRLGFDPAALLTRASEPAQNKDGTVRSAGRGAGSGAGAMLPGILSREALRVAERFEALPAGPGRRAIVAVLAALDGRRPAAQQK